jgi:hypothetical protein
VWAQAAEGGRRAVGLVKGSIGGLAGCGGSTGCDARRCSLLRLVSTAPTLRAGQQEKTLDYRHWGIASFWLDVTHCKSGLR